MGRWRVSPAIVNPMKKPRRGRLPHCGMFIGLSALVGLFVVPGCERDRIVPLARPSARSIWTTPTGTMIHEYWEAHFVRGRKVGHRHVQVFEQNGSQPRLLQKISVDRLQLKRFGGMARQELTTISVETEDGQVHQLGYQIDDGKSQERCHGL